MNVVWLVWPYEFFEYIGEKNKRSSRKSWIPKARRTWRMSIDFILSVTQVAEMDSKDRYVVEGIGKL